MDTEYASPRRSPPQSDSASGGGVSFPLSLENAYGSSSDQVGYRSNSSLQIPEPQQIQEEEEDYHGCRKLHLMQGRSQGAT
ncbi:hypothetical protein SORBI_3007G114301 [Sorghum bicolor]|uniref:Uncharacterized protein n=1 Tax=Sorghum bicolor TaxID=4558 RepID=A0A1Z5RA89_SORBI|nr:hypothetical protein SORBI_3007G114301 [Sorghum bicolor]OQU80345.1 hypothetical protein SORBI_3007G114301 [Sorghum bicolor]